MFVSLNNQKIICFDIVSFIVYCSAIAYVPYRYIIYIIDFFNLHKVHCLLLLRWTALLSGYPKNRVTRLPSVTIKTIFLPH